MEERERFIRRSLRMRLIYRIARAHPEDYKRFYEEEKQFLEEKWDRMEEIFQRGK